MTEKQKMAIAEVLELEIPPEAALTIIEGIMDNEPSGTDTQVHPFYWVPDKDSIGYNINITNK